MNCTPVLSIRGLCCELYMTGCFSTTRALQCKKHISIKSSECATCDSESWWHVLLVDEFHEQGQCTFLCFPHWSSQAGGIDAAVLAVLLLQLLQLSVHSEQHFSNSRKPAQRTQCSVEKLQMFLRFYLNFNCENPGSYHFSRWSRLVSTGLPTQAICCLCFHWGSSTSVRVTTICSACFKMLPICPSTVCNKKKHKW